MNINSANLTAMTAPSSGDGAPPGYLKAKVLRGPDREGGFLLRLDGGREMIVVVDKGVKIPPGTSVLVSPSDGKLMIPTPDAAAQAQAAKDAGLVESLLTGTGAASANGTGGAAGTAAHSAIEINGVKIDVAVTVEKIHDSFESALLKSLPLASLEKIAAERGGLDLETLKALDGILSGRGTAIDPSSPQQVERLEQWLRIALDNPKLIEDLAERAPILGAREIAEKFQLLERVGMTLLSNNVLGEISPERFFLNGNGTGINAAGFDASGLNFINLGDALSLNLSGQDIADKSKLLEALLSKAFSGAPAKLLELVELVKSVSAGGNKESAAATLTANDARKVIGEILSKLPDQIMGKPERLHDARMISPKSAEASVTQAANSLKNISSVNIPTTSINNSQQSIQNLRMTSTNISAMNITPLANDARNNFQARIPAPPSNYQQPSIQNARMTSTNISAVNITPTANDARNNFQAKIPAPPSNYQQPSIQNARMASTNISAMNITPTANDARNNFQARIPAAPLNNSQQSFRDARISSSSIPNVSRMDISPSANAANPAISSTTSKIPAPSINNSQAATINGKYQVSQNTFDRIATDPKFQTNANGRNAVFSQISSTLDVIRKVTDYAGTKNADAKNVSARIDAAYGSVKQAIGDTTRADTSGARPTGASLSSANSLPPSRANYSSPPSPSTNNVVATTHDGAVGKPSGELPSSPANYSSPPSTSNSPAPRDNDPSATARLANSVLTQTEKILTGFKDAFSSLDIQSKVAAANTSGDPAVVPTERSLDALRVSTLLNVSRALQMVFSSIEELGALIEQLSNGGRTLTDQEAALVRAAEALARQARVGGAEASETLNDILRELTRMQTDAMRAEGRTGIARTPAEIMRAAALSAAGGLENLHLLATQTRGTENSQQQMFALPVKMGEEWTEVQVKFIKDRKKDKKASAAKNERVSVYLNVAPSALGRVSANLEFHAPSDLKLAFEFERPEVTKWFKDNSGSLREKLSEAGLPGTALTFHTRTARSAQAEGSKVLKNENDGTVKNIGTIIGKDGKVDFKI